MDIRDITHLLPITALAVMACTSETPSEDLEVAGTALHDACTGEIIGERDPETGDLHFFADDAVVHGEDLRQVGEGATEPSCEPDPSASPQRVWSNGTCWVITEGNFGCEGCWYGTWGWEYCWDYEST